MKGMAKLDYPHMFSTVWKVWGNLKMYSYTGQQVTHKPYVPLDVL